MYQSVLGSIQRFISSTQVLSEDWIWIYIKWNSRLQIFPLFWLKCQIFSVLNAISRWLYHLLEHNCRRVVILEQLFSLSKPSCYRQPLPWWRQWVKHQQYQEQTSTSISICISECEKFIVENPQGQQTYPTILSQFGFLTKWHLLSVQ